jgi:hypothetical protein
MPFSLTLTDRDFDRIAQAWQSGHRYYSGPKWANTYIHLHWDSAESPQPEVSVRWEVHPMSKWVSGNFNFLADPVANNFYRKRLRRGGFRRPLVGTRCQALPSGVSIR